MERKNTTKKVKEEEPILERKKATIEEVIIPLYQFRKIGGGSLRLKNRIIKPGEVFTAYKEDIPTAFLNTLVEIGIAPVQENTTMVRKTTVVKPVEEIYTLKKLSNGKYNVVNLEGKAINNIALSLESAEELKATIEA